MLRAPSRAVAVSIAIHAALLLMLLTLRYERGPESDGKVMYAALVRLGETTAERSDAAPATDVPAEQLANAAEVPAPSPPPEAAPLEPPEPRVAEPAAESEPIADEPPIEQIADEPSSEPITPDEPSSAPVAPVTPEPVPSPLENQPQRVVAGDEPAPTPPPPTADPPPQLVSMPERERRMLSSRFAAVNERALSKYTTESVVWSDAGREYTAKFQPQPAEDSMGIDRLIVEVSTDENGSRWSTQLTMKRLAFSSFAQLIDRWDPQVQIHDDEVDGRFHSNTEIKVLNNREAQPIFHGRVTTAARSIHTDALGRFDRDRMFLGGLETGVGRISLPPRFALLDGNASDASGGDSERVQRFAGDTRIRFYADGTYSASALDPADGEPRLVTVPAEPHYVIAAADSKLHVQGVVNGKVLVYSPEGIVIEGDLVYAHSPPVQADDFLGLVSDKSIEIAPADVTGPGDLSIHASMYAKRQLAVRGYHSRHTGTLFIFGSVSAGSVTATEPRFATKIEYDDRLEDQRAPGFPLTDRYELEDWSGEWRVDDASGDLTID
jgi:outer membrane biosynthesis protein TonB